NFIGTDATGAVALPNDVGVVINNVPNNLIGGTAAGAGNLISGNRNGGIVVSGTTANPATGNVIQGNLIGTNAAGTAAVPNGQWGIATEARGLLIGGTAAGAGNVISGNNGFGVTTVPGFLGAATGTRLQG